VATGRVVLGPGSHPLRIDSRHHSVALVYKLARGGAVVFKLRQVAPACGLVRTFTVHGHAGRNKVRLSLRRFAGTLGGGIFRIRARSRGHTVVRRLLVVGTAVAGESTCSSTAEPASAGDSGSAGGSSSGVSGNSGKLAAAAINAPLPRRPDSGVLGARASKILPGSGETQLALLIVLVAAIALLAVGATPRQVVPSAAAGAFVARRRPLFALAGLAALAAFLVSYFLT
jgi:hypothetical protein